MPCELILALDAPTLRDVAPLLSRVRGAVRWVKIGLELYTAGGPDTVRQAADLGFDVFLDLKLHDIPNTVARTVTSAARLPVKMLTIHTAGGREMMRQAVKAQTDAAPHLRLLGVTVLTSLGAADLPEIGIASPPADQVVRLARLAVDCGMTGLVCSPLELPALRAQLPKSVKLVTPGIRPAHTGRTDDQARVMTPAEAAKAGADFIVVGRPILLAGDAAAAARGILADLA